MSVGGFRRLSALHVRFRRRPAAAIGLLRSQGEGLHLA